MSTEPATVIVDIKAVGFDAYIWALTLAAVHITEVFGLPTKERP